MKKIALFITFTLAVIGGVHAQNQADQQQVASQAAKLVMSNAIDITFVSTGTNTADNMTLSFANVNDYANGIESDQLELKVRSNKRFQVNAKTNASRFTYNGTTSPAPAMPVQNILFIKVVNNSTGGSIPSNVNNKYRTLKTSNTRLINSGQASGNNTFAVKYKAAPGFAYPAGNYTVDVVYTATQY